MEELDNEDKLAPPSDGKHRIVFDVLDSVQHFDSRRFIFTCRCFTQRLLRSFHLHKSDRF